VNINYQKFQTKPFKVVSMIVDCDDEHIRLSEHDLYKSDPEFFGKEFLCCAFRSVSIDKLPAIMKNGIDVVPTDSPIYVGDLDKALEYGGWPKVVMALNWERLKHTYSCVDSNISEAELCELMKTYSTKLESVDGSNYWLSRLDKDDLRATTDYERAYGRWIPDNPFDCLTMVMVIARPSDVSKISSYDVQPPNT
jgi:hypothetical protein